jgi:hypothetical protein
MATAKKSTVLKLLDEKLAVINAKEKEVTPAQKPTEQGRFPSVMEILDNAIKLMPSTDVEFSLLQRYPIGNFKDRMFKARRALETVHTLLSEAD